MTEVLETACSKLQGEVATTLAAIHRFDSNSADSASAKHEIVSRLQAASEIALGVSALARAHLSRPMFALVRIDMEHLISVYWSVQTPENAAVLAGAMKQDLARIARINVKNGFARITRRSTGENVNEEFLRQESIQNAKRLPSVARMAEDSDLEEFYQSFYRFLSMFVHGTAGDLQGDVSTDSRMAGGVEACRSNLEALRRVVSDFVLYSHVTPRTELYSILGLQGKTA